MQYPANYLRSAGTVYNHTLQKYHVCTVCIWFWPTLHTPITAPPIEPSVTHVPATPCSTLCHTRHSHTCSTLTQLKSAGLLATCTHTSQPPPVVPSVTHVTATPVVSSVIHVTATPVVPSVTHFTATPVVPSVTHVTATPVVPCHRIGAAFLQRSSQAVQKWSG
jgi:hypothetical protein